MIKKFTPTYFKKSGNNISTIDSSVKLGIGTINPVQRLDIDKGNLRMNRTAAPSTAPTVAVNATAGNLNGTYRYRVTFVTALGETETTAASSPVSPVNQQVNLTNIPVSADSNVIARKIYRTPANGAWPYFCKFLTTINNNVDTTYTDNIPDGSLGAYASENNTTGALIYLDTNIIARFDTQSLSIGYGCLPSSTSFGNTAVGSYALNKNTLGYSNLAFGALSLYNNTTGSSNTGIGAGALYTNTTGSGNLAIGGNALYFCNGSSNVAVGNSSMYNTTGYSNVAIGGNSLYGNTSGYQNLGIGYNAGRYISGGSSPNQTSNNSVYLGYNTMALADGDTNEIVIGASAVGAGSNSVVLGNDSVTKTILKGNVGIGTTSPGAKLDIEGGALMVDSGGAGYGLSFKKLDNTAAWNFGTGGTDHRTLQLYRVDGGVDERWMRFDALNQYGEGAGIHLRPGGTHVMAVLSSSKVGIGTTSPNANLDVAPTIGSNIVTNGNFNSDLSNWTGTDWYWQTDGAGGGWARHTTGTANDLYQTSATVTIGQTYKLVFTVGGATSGLITCTVGGFSSQGVGNGTYTFYFVATATTRINFHPSSTSFDGYIDSVSLQLVTNGNVAVGNSLTVNGYVGIGKAPSNIYALDVKGLVNVNGFSLNNYSGITKWWVEGSGTGGNNFYWRDSSSNYYITLDQTGDMGYGAVTNIFRQRTVVLSPATGTVPLTIIGKASQTAHLFDVKDSAGTVLYCVDNVGNVGIGTTSPNANAILDLTSTTKAFMPPRMTTTQRNAIGTPTAGMVIYNSSTNKLNVYTTAWEEVTSA